MKKITFIFFAAGLLFPVLNLRADTGDEFMKAFIFIQEGDVAVKASDNPKAVEKFSAALKILRQIRRLTPDWQTNVVAFRTKYVTDQIIKAGGKVEEDSSTSVEVSSAATISPINTIPSGATPSTPAPPSSSVPDTTSLDTSSTGSPDRIAILERELKETRAELQRVKEELANQQKKDNRDS